MPDKHTFFVTGIDTGIGKTIVSAVLTEKLKADYWKPVQSGDLDDSDTLKVKSLVSNNRTVFHPEQKKEIVVWNLLGMYAWHGKHHVAHITNLRERNNW